MSIESVRARVAEIEGRIAGLMERLDPPDEQFSAPSANSADGIATAAGGPLNGNSGVMPFNVALAAQFGQIGIKPTASNPALTPQIEALISKYSALNGLDPAVVRAVIRAESDGNRMEVSNKGAMGLMQLMPDELKAYGVRDPFDMEQNVMGGTRQLAEKLKLFNGDLHLALAAYNAGTGRVRQYGGIPPFPETQKYVDKIMGMLAKP